MTGTPSGQGAGAAAATAAATRARIVDAAIHRLAREGVSGASMSAIAEAGHVSKALLHYHFADRTRLLTEVLTALTSRAIAREERALEHVPGNRAVDAVWTWLEAELARGELRALLELSASREAALRAAGDTARHRRRRAATHTVELVFGKLGLAPRISTALLGAATLTFVDGLILHGGEASSERDTRVSFDVFWLALLGLAT